MAKYLAKRLCFQNQERHSVLQVVNGLPVHEVTLYLKKYRTRGRAANTIHAVCRCLALLYRHLDSAKINLLALLYEGRFLSSSQLNRLATAAQYRMDDLDKEDNQNASSKVISVDKIGYRKKKTIQLTEAVDTNTQGRRLRYIADFLEFISEYIGTTLEDSKGQLLKSETASALKAFKEHIPPSSGRAKINARVGLSIEEQNRLLEVVDLNSPINPWARGYTRIRNRLIVVIYLATGMRRGELLGLQIGDLSSTEPKLKIIRRADEGDDPRTIQPGTKTYDREIELAPRIMKALWSYIQNERYSIKAARKVPQVFVSDEGDPLSHSSMDKIFFQIRKACPDLPKALTSHVLRHTWNERFSEEADAMGLSENAEERARNSQQGWSDNSKMASTYTRRHTTKKGRELSLKLQEKLDGKIGEKN
ncbi:tyrosine-type recombinase/integrase [Massilia varians]|uniref:tyrosine-type recombinase/integrase n=1 Tax=Massilia varians TaxID=457921 RepID=UPI002556FE92|nr:site-specific integrase [Massilia varians]MDK6080193.1 site-specific integrase [Massilia varians]